MSTLKGGNEMKDISLQNSVSDLSDMSGSCVGLKTPKQQSPPPHPRTSRPVASRGTVSHKKKKESKQSFSKSIGLRRESDMSVSEVIGLRNGAKGGRRLSKEAQEFQAYCRFRDSQLKRNIRGSSKSPDRSKSFRRNRNYLGLRPSQKEYRERHASSSRHSDTIRCSDILDEMMEFCSFPLMLANVIDHESSVYFNDDDPFAIKCCIVPSLVAQTVRQDVDELDVIPVLQESLSFPDSVSLPKLPTFDVSSSFTMDDTPAVDNGSTLEDSRLTNSKTQDSRQNPKEQIGWFTSLSEFLEGRAFQNKVFSAEQPVQSIATAAVAPVPKMMETTTLNVHEQREPEDDFF